LHLRGEQVFPLAPLDPIAAIELFRSRAEAAGSGVIGEASFVAEICRRLDNLPLAIELAASRSATLTASALLARLDDRLGLLVDGPRDLPDRQRTLRETLRWSGSLLRDHERDGLAHLGVFAGGCSLEAAEAVGGVGLDQIETLVAHSLINRTLIDDQPRFGLHETVREYALELLGNQSSATERRHAAYFADLAWRYFEFLTGPDYLDGTLQAAWLGRMDADAANLRAAFDWSIREREAELALRLVAGLWRYRHVRGHLAEGLAEAEHALALDGSPAASLTGFVRGGAAGLAFGLGQYELATSLATEAAAAASDDLHVALTGENVLGLVASQLHNFEAAHEHFVRVRELAAELGSEAEEMTAVINLGEVAYEQGDYDTATAYWSEFLAFWRERESHEGIGLGLLNLGFAALRLGNLDRAADHMREARSHFEAIGFREHIGYTFLAEAAVHLRRNQPEDGAVLLGVALQILEGVGAAAQSVDRTLADETELALRTALGEEAFEIAVQSGRNSPSVT
jgi:tetratricopeptide (TPR) repeat protein